MKTETEAAAVSVDQSWTWRHAVAARHTLLVTSSWAAELLVEWGAARGLVQASDVIMGEWDYGYWKSFAMHFSGRKSKAGVSRLWCWGSCGAEPLRGREEAWPRPGARLREPSAGELAAALQSDDLAAWDLLQTGGYETSEVADS